MWTFAFSLVTFMEKTSTYQLAPTSRLTVPWLCRTLYLSKLDNNPQNVT